MEPIRPLGNISLKHCLLGSQQPYQVCKEGHFLRGAKTQDILGTLGKEEVTLIFTQVKSDDKHLAWPLCLKRLLKFDLQILMKSSSTEESVGSISIFGVYFGVLM